MFSVMGPLRRRIKASLSRHEEYTGVCRPDQEGEDIPGWAYSSTVSAENTR